jgi:hypothetical protein
MIKSRRMRWAGHVAHMGEMRNVHKILVRKPERKRSFRSSSHRWENNIRIDIREIGLEGMDWNHLTQDWDQWQDPVNVVMNL